MSDCLTCDRGKQDCEERRKFAARIVGESGDVSRVEIAIVTDQLAFPHEVDRELRLAQMIRSIDVEERLVAEELGEGGRCRT
jgi:hypothetical protein